MQAGEHVVLHRHHLIGHQRRLFGAGIRLQFLRGVRAPVTVVVGRSGTVVSAIRGRGGTVVSAIRGGGGTVIGSVIGGRVRLTIGIVRPRLLVRAFLRRSLAVVRREAEVHHGLGYGVVADVRSRFIIHTSAGVIVCSDGCCVVSVRLSLVEVFVVDGIVRRVLVVIIPRVAVRAPVVIGTVVVGVVSLVTLVHREVRDIDIL